MLGPKHILTQNDKVIQGHLFAVNEEPLRSYIV